MIKKLLVTSISLFILSGCGEKKEVTEDMLVGEWKCNGEKKQIIYDQMGIPKKFENIEKLEPYNVTYSKDSQDSELMVMQYDYSYFKPDKFKFKTKDESEYEPFILSNNLDMKSSEEYIFISMNEFKLVTNVSFRYHLSKEIHETNELERFCTRVK